MQCALTIQFSDLSQLVFMALSEHSGFIVGQDIWVGGGSCRSSKASPN